MHAVLLAAGLGQRLTEITGGGPKCLLPFAQRSLLERHLGQLRAAGVESLTVVVGFEAMQIEQALGALAPEVAPKLRIDTLHNPAFRQGSAKSVLAARRVLEGDDDVLLMDADVLYDQRMLAALLPSGGADVLALDTRVGAGDDEAVKVGLKNDRIVGFDKRLPGGLDYDVVGESVGFFRLSPATADALLVACRRAAEADDDASYEAALEQVMRAGHAVFKAVDVSDLPWIEIDYPEDVERAMAAVLPQLQMLED